jgi:Nif-specific regulatory protein
METGARAGTSYLLDPTDHNSLGRDTDCDIVLVDPLCSRVHAEVVREEDGWWIGDADSRNGTFVNGQKIDRARLDAGAHIRVGSTEFVFNSSDERPTLGTASEMQETIVREEPCDTGETQFLSAVHAGDGVVPDLMVLYQLSLKLLSCDDPDQVVYHALQQLHQRTKAAVAGFLWVSDAGQLKPKLILPADPDGPVPLSQMLTDSVCRRLRAIWVNHQATRSAPQDYTDAICVPLVEQRKAFGAIHLYRREGSFRQVDFEFSISLASLLSSGLLRARRHALLASEHLRLRASSATSDQLLGESEPMRDLKSRIERLGATAHCVLLRGESGSGKELVARVLHRASHRADRPLLAVSCAAVGPDFIEEHLFGNARSAPGNVPGGGLLQRADSGTLLLDDISELPLPAQAKLVRVLEGQAFLPAGASREIQVDVRVLAATRRPLEQLLPGGRFREDLYYLLSVFSLVIPPLRERGDDIGLLIDHFLGHFRRQHGRPAARLSDEARQRLLEHPWPGNVRQLRNVIDSAVLLCDQDLIQADQLGLDQAASHKLDSLRLDVWEQRLIRQALDRTRGKVPEAARLLGIGRATLYRKLEQYGIQR